jgi:hypothetical protein
MRVLHCADLHLSSSEPEYGLAVLDELLETVLREQVDLWLFAGDTFDSYADLEALRAAFRERMQRLAGKATVLLIPGNHDSLGAAAPCLERLDVGVPFRVATPWELVDIRGVEILVVPWGADLSDFLSWQVPARGSRVRLLLAHGTVTGMQLSGPADEADDYPIDQALFSRLSIDYAALGHIHAGRMARPPGARDTLVAYPGSARVWRRGESGPRRAILLDADPATGALTHRGVELVSAGQYRLVERPLDLEGACPDLSGDAASWGCSDWVELRLSGLVEDEAIVADLERSLQALYAARLRRFEVVRDDILVLGGIASQPIARRFLELWSARRSSADPEVWLAARDAGLRKIKAVLEARR